ncbi:hypothetical protein AKJ16_DCAP05599 [Drosera capensis]
MKVEGQNDLKSYPLIWRSNAQSGLQPLQPPIIPSNLKIKDTKRSSTSNPPILPSNLDIKGPKRSSTYNSPILPSNLEIKDPKWISTSKLNRPNRLLCLSPPPTEPDLWISAALIMQVYKAEPSKMC